MRVKRESKEGEDYFLSIGLRQPIKDKCEHVGGP